MTSRTRKLMVGVAVIMGVVMVVAVGTGWLWPRNVYTYQGKTVELWFEGCAKTEVTRGNVDPALAAAFGAMGTNCAPFLTSVINRPNASRIDLWAGRLPVRLLQPKFHLGESIAASRLLLRAQVREQMLSAMLKPALQSTNQSQRSMANRAIFQARHSLPP